jgi:hypothetical protein
MEHRPRARPALRGAGGVDRRLGLARIAALPAHAEDGRLGEGSRAMVRAKQATAAPSARAAGLLTVGKALQEDPVLRVIRTFERSVAEDTVRNEYGFHRKIHEWFATRAPETLAQDAGALDRLNERVYSELFLTRRATRGSAWCRRTCTRRWKGLG